MYDVVKHYVSVSDEIIKGFAETEESASINECLPRNGSLNHEFRPVWPGSRACGRAFTVECRAGDNLILQKALIMLKPGDFVIVACDGFQESGGMWGGIMSNIAQVQGAAGLVMDGSVRDTMMMKNIGFPAWSRGISVKRSTKLTPGKINNPIVIGGVLVNPGDLIFADNDAVICVPKEIAEETLKKVQAREKSEDETLIEARKNPCYNWHHYGFKDAYEKLNLNEEPD